MFKITDENLFWLFGTQRIFRVRYNNPSYMRLAPSGTDPINIQELFEYIRDMEPIAVIKTGTWGVYNEGTAGMLTPRTKFYMADIDELIKMRLVFGSSIQAHYAEFHLNSYKVIWRDFDDGTDCTI